MRGPLLVYIKKFRSFIDFINKLQFPYQHQKFLMIIVPGQLKVFGFFFNVHATTVLLTTGSTKVDLESEGKHISCRNEHWFFPPSSTPVLKMCHLPLCCYCLKWTSNEKCGEQLGQTFSEKNKEKKQRSTVIIIQLVVEGCLYYWCTYVLSSILNCSEKKVYSCRTNCCCSWLYSDQC